MEENKLSFDELSNKYRDIFKKYDIFKSVTIGLSVLIGIYALFAIISLIDLSTHNREIMGTLIPFIIILVIGFGGIGVCTYFWINYSKKVLEIKELGLKNYKEFVSVIDQVELRRVDRVSKTQKIVITSLIYIFLTIMAVIVIFPFYWMINSSLKSVEEYKLTIPTFWPKIVHFSNYAEAYSTANLGQLFINTLYVGLVSTLLSLVITVISAFAFARLEFKGKNVLFAALLATMMIPGELFTITNYATVSQWDWKSTFAALIIPFLVSVFYIYLLRQNFMQIPNELYLAAKVDGTSDMKYLIKVMVPLSMPTLISITILKMMGAWNSYVWPNLVASDAAHQLITNGLRNSFTDSTGDVNYPIQMAAVALVSLPLFLVFIFLRKYIMKGVSRSGIKG